MAGRVGFSTPVRPQGFPLLEGGGAEEVWVFDLGLAGGRAGRIAFAFGTEAHLSFEAGVRRRVRCERTDVIASRLGVDCMPAENS